MMSFEEPKLEQPEHRGNNSDVAPKIVRGSDITAILFGGGIFLVLIGVGMLNILAARGGWNPLHWQGRFWTGVSMIAAPSLLAVIAVLPLPFRSKIPDPILGLAVLCVWIAFFWAACSGR